MCRTDCTNQRCGDGIDPDEECDDGNDIALDGCNRECLVVDGTFEAPAATCRGILDTQLDSADGSYWLLLDGAAGPSTMVYCDMQNGGWTTLGLAPPSE